MRALLVLTTFIVGCEQEPVLSVDPPDPPPAGCGDAVCADGETAYACPTDCWNRIPVHARELGRCTAGKSREQVGRDVDVSMAFARSLVGLTGALEAYGDFAGAAYDVLVSLGLAPDKPANPEGVVHDASTGTYAFVREPGAVTTYTLRFGADYSAAKTGEIIKPHFFLADSYLVDVSVRTSGSSATIDAYKSPGPLVELLGLGPTPTAPFVITQEQANKEPAKQRLAGSMTWDVAARGTRTTWRAEAAGGLAPGTHISVALESASARDDRGDEAVATHAFVEGYSATSLFRGIFISWDVRIDWEARGAFPHRGSLRYSSLGERPTRLVLECP